jgi:hypothetical protein
LDAPAGATQRHHHTGGNEMTNQTNQTKEIHMTPSTIKIDNTEYVRADLLPKPEGDFKIVVLDRGFVYAGTVQVGADFVTIHDAKNIRVWGTTKGLGELVNGPLAKTVLDATGTVRAPLRAVIALIDADGAKWNAR